MLQKLKSSDTGAKSLPGEEKTCPVPVDLVSVPPGIVKTTVDTEGQSIAIDYDPRAINDESVRQVAARLMPEAQRRFDKCVMRLGGRACEACALKLERKAQRIQGVRRARATFIGGVMSVTFDNAQLSPEQLIGHVRRTGAPVTPFTVPRELPHNIGEWLQYHSGRIEAACTVLTFIFMIAGWLAPRVGLGQIWANIFFTTAVGFMEEEAVKAGIDVIVVSETTELIADDTLKGLEPYPTKIKVVLDARTMKLLGCLAIGDQAIDVVNLCSMLIKSRAPVNRLSRYRFVHPSAAEALQRCVDRVTT